MTRRKVESDWEVAKKPGAPGSMNIVGYPYCPAIIFKRMAHPLPIKIK